MQRKRYSVKRATPYVYAMDPRKDKNPNLFYLNPVTLTAAGTFNIAESMLPIPRNMYQKNRATVIEVLKVTFKIRATDSLIPCRVSGAGTQAARLQVGLSTRNLQLQQSGSIIQNATDTANIAEKTVYLPDAGSASTMHIDNDGYYNFEIDMQSKDGYGVVVAVDKLFTYFVANSNVTLGNMQSAPVSWTTANGQGALTVVACLHYRHINVNTQAFIGAVQQLQ